MLQSRAGGLVRERRVARSRPQGTSGDVCAPAPPPNRPKKLKLWSEEQMSLAVEAVRSGEMGVRRAHQEFGVPKSTLHDRISGRVQEGAVSGPQAYLTKEEEDELVHFLVECAQFGFPRTRKQVISIAQAVASQRHDGVEVSSGWWQSFRHRHPEIVLRNPEALSRARYISQSVIDQYYDLLKQTLQDNELEGHPELLFNCDETGISLDHKPEKVVTSTAIRHTYAPTSGDKTHISVLACVSASGQVLPPMVLLEGKHLQHSLTIGEVPGTMYGMGSGWMDNELF